MNERLPRRPTPRSKAVLFLSMITYGLAVVFIAGRLQAPFWITRGVLVIGEVSLIVWVGRFLPPTLGYMFLAASIYGLIAVEVVHRLDAPGWALPVAGFAGGCALFVWDRFGARRPDQTTPPESADLP